MEQRMCPVCGRWNPAQTAFCDNCGNSIRFHPPELAGMPPLPPEMSNRQETAGLFVLPPKLHKIAGRGFGITSMVLGIIGLVNSLLISVLSGYDYYYIENNPAQLYLPFLIIAAIMPILALIFGIVAKKRGYRCAVSTAGIATGIVGLCAVTAAIILAIVNM